MKQNIEEQSFVKQTDRFAYPVAMWQHKKPAQRSAFMLFCDKEVGQWAIIPLGNKRAKYPEVTCLRGLNEALKANPELLGWMKAVVRCAERELKREREANGQ